MTDKVQKIREEVERLRNLHQIKYQNLDTNDNTCLVECGKRNLCNELLSFIDSLQEEPVSEGLEEAATNYATHLDKNWSTVKDGYIAENEKEAFKAGAEWQEKKDQSIIELDEDHAMLAGMEKMREQMMNEAMHLQHDWDALRNQAAIAAMQGVMNFFGSIDYNRETIAKLAVEQADALIEKLKEKSV